MPFPSLSEDIITDGAALCEPRPAYKAPTWALVSRTATDLPHRLPASGQDQESSERVRGCAPQTSLCAPRRTRTGFGCPRLTSGAGRAGPWGTGQGLPFRKLNRQPEKPLLKEWRSHVTGRSRCDRGDLAGDRGL